MPSRTPLLFFLCGLAASLTFFGCATKLKPVVWTDQEVSFADFRTLEVQPVFNATGMPLEEGILSGLTALLMERFAKEKLPINASPEITSGVLVVRSELVLYEAYMPAGALRSTGPAGWGEAKCILRTRLVDKATNRAVAEIVAVKIASSGSVNEIPFGGASYVNQGGGDTVLHKVAAAVAEEVIKLMVIREP